MRRKHYLSVVIPIYNEEESIPLLHKQLKQVLSEQEFSYEIIYVDDGSTDGTFTQLQTQAQQDPHIRIIQLRRNFGQTAAMAAGVDASTGEILVFMDGDLQNDPTDIPHLLMKLEEGYDIVSGWRKNRKDARLSRKLPSWLANRLISKVTGLHLHDYGCTLKAFRWEVFQHMRLYGEMHRFLPAYAALIGAKITEIEVAHHPRRFGSSKYGISRTVRVVLDLLTLKFFGKYTTRPLHAFGLLGFLLMLCGLAVPIIAQGQHLCSRAIRSSQQTTHAKEFLSQPATAKAFHSTTTLSGFGLQCILLGIVAELLTRTYHESQGKPIYTIQTTVTGMTSAREKTEAA